jgi:hypothetical protein
VVQDAVTYCEIPPLARSVRHLTVGDDLVLDAAGAVEPHHQQPRLVEQPPVLIAGGR